MNFDQWTIDLRRVDEGDGALERCAKERHTFVLTDDRSARFNAAAKFDCKSLKVRID
jgi:hypothetical protein